MCYTCEKGCVAVWFSFISFSILQTLWNLFQLTKAFRNERWREKEERKKSSCVVLVREEFMTEMMRETIRVWFVFSQFIYFSPFLIPDSVAVSALICGATAAAVLLPADGITCSIEQLPANFWWFAERTVNCSSWTPERGEFSVHCTG